MTRNRASAKQAGARFERLIADALRDAARDLPGFDGIRTHGDAAQWLRDRADAIDGGAE